MWVSSATNEAQDTTYVMRLEVDYTTKTWTVHSIYPYISAQRNQRVHDAGNSQHTFHVYDVAGHGRYFVAEGDPGVQIIDQTNWTLVPATVAGGNQQWVDGWNWTSDPPALSPNTKNGLVEDIEVKTYPGTAATEFQISHVDAGLDQFYVDIQGREVKRRHVIGWAGNAPIYDGIPDGNLVATPPQRFTTATYLDGRWSAFLYHDVASNALFGALNGENVVLDPAATQNFGLFTDAFMQKWDLNKSPQCDLNPSPQCDQPRRWSAGELSGANQGNTLSAEQPNEPGEIYTGFRSMSGLTHGCIVATDFEGGWSTDHAHTYVWDSDGLYVGGLMDDPDLEGVPEYMYDCGGEFQNSTLVDSPATSDDVYFAGNWENDVRVYRVSGWDPAKWSRQDGNLFVDAPGPATGQGLRGSYYDNRNFSDERTTRVDGPVSFSAWGSGVPGGTNLTSPDTFSVRWVGNIRPPIGPTYSGLWRVVAGAEIGVAGLSDDVAHVATQEGAQVDFAFRGSSIKVLGPHMTGAGTVRFTLRDATTSTDIEAVDVNLAALGDGSPFYQHSGLSNPSHDYVLSALVTGIRYSLVVIDGYDVDGIAIDDQGAAYELSVAYQGGGAQLWLNNSCVAYDWATGGASSVITTAKVKLPQRQPCPAQLLQRHRRRERQVAVEGPVRRRTD